MTALILAAGLGTRLQPLTRDRAKPAVPVAGRSLVERIVGGLAAQGVCQLIVNLHYRPESITALLGEGRALGVRVRYSWEQPVLGSGGGPRRAFGLVADERLLVVNGDTLTDVDVEALGAAHRESGALATLAVVPNPDPARYGGVLVDAGGVVTGFTRRGSAAPSWHFVGMQVAEREAFAGLTDGEKAESVAGIYPLLMASRPGAVRAFRTRAAFHDIGTPRDYLDTCLTLGGGSVVGASTGVDPAAHVAASVLWDDVVVEAGASLDRCIVLDGVRVPAGFRATGAVVAPEGPAPLLPGERRSSGLRLVPIGGANGAPSS